MNEAVFATKTVDIKGDRMGFNALHRPINTSMKVAYVEEGHADLENTLKAAGVEVLPLSELPKPKPVTAKSKAVKGE